jgi:hypothetical protein
MGHRLSIDPGPAGHGVRRQEAFQLIVCGIGGPPGNLAQFMEAAGVCQESDPFADGQLASSALAFDGFFAAHFLGQPFPAAEFLNRFFPTHAATFHASPAQRQADVKPVSQDFSGHGPENTGRTARL